MKKLLFISLFISFKIFGQSVLLTPSTIIKKNSLTDDIRIQSYSTYPSIFGIRANGNVTLPTVLSAGNLFFLISAGGYNGFNFTGPRASIRFNATQNWTDTANGTSITFGTTSNNSIYNDDRMVINHDGNIGIGISAPTAKLDVVRGTAPDGTAIFRGTTHVSHFNYSTNEDTYIRGGKNSSRVIINDVVDLGNVGIGTNNPQAKLHISQGNLRVDALAGNGNVQLYADDNGTVSAALPVAFSAKYNASLTPINNVTSLTFPFSTENYDEGGFYNNSTYEFSAPLAGIYHFDCAVTFGVVNSASGTSMCSLSILVDGASSAISTQDLKVGGYKTVNLSQDIKLNAGQKVKISIYQSSGNTINLVGFSNSFFTGRLVTRL